MTKKDILKILFLVIIVGTIMGIVIIEIFGAITILNFMRLEISLIFIIVFLFIASSLWNKRLKKKEMQR
jgi:high-affinity Fe2+/Pb2+ permease